VTIVSAGNVRSTATHTSVDGAQVASSVSSNARFLYGVSTADGLAFAAAPLLLLAAVFLACDLPARRASRVDPQEALRAGG